LINKEIIYEWNTRKEKLYGNKNNSNTK
jgi:hypothetical protein